MPAVQSRGEAGAITGSPAPETVGRSVAPEAHRSALAATKPAGGVVKTLVSAGPSGVAAAGESHAGFEGVSRTVVSRCQKVFGLLRSLGRLMAPDGALGCCLAFGSW